jgi:hypothetical protein
MLLSKIYRKAAEILDRGYAPFGGRGGARTINTPEYAMLMLQLDGSDKRSHAQQLAGMAEYAANGHRWGLTFETADPSREKMWKAGVIGLLLLSEIARDDERKRGRK